MPEPVMIRSVMPPMLTHVALQVDDVNAMARFYRDYCGMHIAHQRAASDGEERVVWLAEPGREDELVIVLMPGQGTGRQRKDDYSHLGFALDSREEVDALAERAKRDGRLVWPPRDEPYPVGYFCGVEDPSGNVVEFSYGQPLGPGAPEDEA